MAARCRAKRGISPQHRVPSLAAVDRQSGPRPEARILHQPALEGLNNSTRTESPHHGDRNKSDHEAAARGARRRREVCGEEKGGGQVEARDAGYSTFMKHDSNIYKRSFYTKMDEVVANVISSQTALQTSLVHQFTEHQLQIASELDFVKIQLAELVNHLKDAGDAKRGKGEAVKRYGFCRT
ncbi:protein NETWORKED 2D [Dorcoceras hygrometricum]|uniref:Protein NETWORKED 2D n=1 Tax=Dorcoceras hygrometricum TaxID=472368 RepID=A0A2Z7D716_9LAMI|nr:protein NETWORKED 2D [Dorcoceras hygrometricum]